MPNKFQWTRAYSRQVHDKSKEDLFGETCCKDRKDRSQTGNSRHGLFSLNSMRGRVWERWTARVSRSHMDKVLDQFSQPTRHGDLRFLCLQIYQDLFNRRLR